MTQADIDRLLKKYNGTRDELLLFGIRDDSAPESDQFNDFIGYVTKDTIQVYKGTTDPGVYWTFHKINPPHGAAHMVTGFHPSMYSIGKHFQWDALVQTGPCKIWRDDNNDFKYNIGEPNHEGLFGINYHHANNSPTIGQWSAGCQVIQRVDDLNAVLKAVCATEKYKKTPAARFSYLLVNKGDL